MSRPTRGQVHELVERFRTTDWRDVERRLLAALRDDERGGSNDADGFPRSSGGGGSGPASIPVDRDDPEQGSVTLTSTEAAAEARLCDSGKRDRLHHHLEHAVGYLHQGAGIVGALTSRLDLIDQLHTPQVVDVKWCESCARINVQRKVEHYGDVGGRLHRPMHLCVQCYDFTARKAERLPSVEELQAHEQTGRWRVRVVQTANAG